MSLERLNLDNVAKLAYLYAVYCGDVDIRRGGVTSPRCIEYSTQDAKNEIRNEFFKAIKIKNDFICGPIYINTCIEDMVATDAAYSYRYARDVLSGRFPAGEMIITSSAAYSYNYALNILDNKFLKGEKAIATDAQYSYYYAKHVLDGRFRKGESTILKDSHISIIYARDVLGRRWLKAEPTIRNSEWWNDYKRYFDIK